MSEPTPNLAQRLVSAMGASGQVARSGRRTDQGYKYVAWDDVAETVQTAFAAAGILCLPTVVDSGVESARTSQDKPTWRASVLVEFRLINADDPADTLTFRWPGQADDSGDKAVQKALTYAAKYGLMKLLLIAGDDSDETGTVSEHDTTQADAGRAVVAPCPTCGAPLRQRTSARGPFLSCSSYKGKEQPGCGQRPLDGTLEAFAARAMAPVRGHVTDEQVAAAIPANGTVDADALRAAVRALPVATARDIFTTAGAIAHFRVVGDSGDISMARLAPATATELLAALTAARG